MSRGRRPCIAPGCDSLMRANGFCVRHLGQWTRAVAGPCSVDGCDRKGPTKGLCDVHYKASRNAQHPPCSVDGCDRPMDSLDSGICNSHRVRRKVRGDLLADVPLGDIRGTAHPNWRPAATYGTAHRHVRQLRGPASAHVCPCGKPAREWAYDHADPDERTEARDLRGRGVRVVAYSTDPEHYRAMCHGCHVRFDQARAAAR